MSKVRIKLLCRELPTLELKMNSIDIPRLGNMEEFFKLTFLLLQTYENTSSFTGLLISSIDGYMHF